MAGKDSLFAVIEESRSDMTAIALRKTNSFSG